MATVVPETERTRVAPDPRIVHPLDQLRGYIRRFVFLDGLLAAALFLVAWFWFGLALDFGLFKVSGFDWVQDAPRGLRIAALVALAVLLVAIVTTWVVLRLTREFSYPSLALVLEKRYPQILGDRLITAVELADVDKQARVGYSPQMIQQTIAEAREAVGRVPVREVFNWRRLWRKLLLAVVGMVVLSAVWYGLAAAFGRVTAPGEFAWRSADVVGIWAERNLLLKNTPWPRRAHLELVDFPSEGLRVGKSDAPPKVRVRAYEWVTADPTSRDGWRPLRWSDLDGFAVAAPQTMTVNEVGDWTPQSVAQAALVGAARLTLTEKAVAIREVALAEMTADAVFAAFPPDSHAEIEAVAVRLDELAAKPSMSRTLRHLAIPADVTLTYRGLPADPTARGRDQGSTSGTLRLTREPNGDFSAEVTGLKESVAFVVRAEDFRTEPRDIILVPPPMLTRLSRVESQPAYLFHPAPQVLRPDGTPEPPRFELLKGLKQVLAEKDLSLTGDKSVCSVPAGTEMVLIGTADKPLAQVFVQPRSGRVPGAAEGSTAPVPVPVEGDTFRVAFAGPNRVTQSVEFELVMVDHDGVKSSRPVLIQAVDDQAPSVEVAVDVLRKIGNTYWCTPAAQVPFVKESIVRDDTGLSKVEFQFTVTRVEASVVVGLQLQAVAGVWAYAPAVSGLGAALGPTASAVTAAQLGKGEQKQFAALPVGAFERAYQALQADTAALLKQKLAKPLANPDAPAVVRDVKFALDGDVFDLEAADRLLAARGRKLIVTDPAEVQPRFRVELDVVATDVNVESGPKQGRNLEPIRLLLVSEADLLAEIGKDEEALIGKLDDALRLLTGTQTKLNQQAERLLGTPPPEQLLAARVRAEDIIQDVGKARELSQVVGTEYARLRREVEVNRVALERDADGRLVSKVGQRYGAEIIRPLEQAQANQFKFAEDALSAYRAPLLAGARPDDPLTLAARTGLEQLIAALQAIRNRLGESININKLREALQKIIKDQKLVAEAVRRLRDHAITSLFAPKVLPVGPVVLARGETKAIIHAVEWNVFEGDGIKVRVEPQPGSAITGPGEVTVSADRNDFRYELTAGDKPGEYTVRLIPSVGEPIEVKVTVK
ncbi:MAG TPA: hypothetical protein VFG68_08165 [Fimbriiglobus sp.]|nr:hypothetical protein [Fimbriiglobus sp.]